MTKKDYIAVAKIISENTIVNKEDMIDKTLLVDELAHYFKQDNKLFDEKRFKDACK